MRAHFRFLVVLKRVFKLLSLTPFWLKATAWCKPGGECRQQLTCINSEGTHTSPPEQTVTTGTIAELSKEMQIYSMGILARTHKFEPKQRTWRSPGTLSRSLHVEVCYAVRFADGVIHWLALEPDPSVSSWGAEQITTGV